MAPWKESQLLRWGPVDEDAATKPEDQGFIQETHMIVLGRELT